MPWVDLEDGNADKEAEKLIPSPNFYVLILFRRKQTTSKGKLLKGGELRLSHGHTLEEGKVITGKHVLPDYDCSQKSNGHLATWTVTTTMSRPSKSLTASRLNDLVLGSFGLVPSSETLDHLVRYLSTWSGSE